MCYPNGDLLRTLLQQMPNLTLDSHDAKGQTPLGRIITYHEYKDKAERSPAHNTYLKLGADPEAMTTAAVSILKINSGALKIDRAFVLYCEGGLLLPLPPSPPYWLFNRHGIGGWIATRNRDT